VPTRDCSQAGQDVGRELGDALHRALREESRLDPKSVSVTCGPLGIVVQLPPGRLALGAPLDLSSTARTAAGHALVVSGSRQNRTVLTGGMRDLVWRRPENQAVLQRLPPAARDAVLVAQLPPDLAREARFRPRGFGRQGLGSHPELFDGETRLPVARWPDAGQAVIVEPGPDGRTFSLDAPEAPDLPAGARLEAHGYWYHDWADFHHPVMRQDTVPASYAFVGPAPQYGVKAGQRAYLYNTPELLDRPGEWFLDQEAGQIYLWPPRGVERLAEVEVSAVERGILLRGGRDVSLEDLTVEKVRGDGIVVEDARNVRLARCEVANVGGRGVVIEGEASGLDGCCIHDTGDGGATLAGGDRRTLRPGGMFATGNVIRRTSAWTRTYAPALKIAGVANQATGNVFEDLPHAAVLVYGNDHLVAWNIFDRIAWETGDVGAVYLQRDWTMRGNIVRNNLFADIQGVGEYGATAVYLDDFISGTEIVDNIFHRVHRGVLIGGGRDNRVQGNLFAFVTLPIHLDSRGENWRQELVEDRNSALWQGFRAVPVADQTYRTRYPSLMKLPEDEPQQAKNNLIAANLLVGSTLVGAKIAHPERQAWSGNVELPPPEVLKSFPALAAPAASGRLPLDELRAVCCAEPWSALRATVDGLAARFRLGDEGYVPRPPEADPSG
jgi:hypothetical protein